MTLGQLSGDDTWTNTWQSHPVRDFGCRRILAEEHHPFSNWDVEAAAMHSTSRGADIESLAPT